MSLSKEAAISRKIQFVCLFILLGISLTTQPGFAQNPLNFGNNFFVTGDYIVAGAYGVNTTFQTINGTSYTVGTITVPDGNPGIQGATKVPKGAQVVAALLYWQTVEMAGAKAGGPGSGQNGFFRPLLYKSSGGPAAPGYPISGTNVGSTNAVTWSSGTCAGTSSSKITRTYRADVGGGLPIDANGNQVANGSFEVRLPSVGTPSTPLTFGATLFIIYRIPTGASGPNVPLNAIVFFDGAADPGATTGSVTQLLNGFYDADLSPISRLTYIGGNGSPGRTETLSLSSTGPLGANAPVPLPSLYPKLPTFPGYYSSSYGWDNPTWKLSSPNNPIQNDAFSATTQLVPSGTSAGCISTAAVIFSTTVDNPEHDGILHSWKTNQGYCDATINIACSGSGDPAWVALPGAVAGEQDVFLQYDYVCSNVTTGPGNCHTSTVIDPLSAATPTGGATTYTGTFSPPIAPNTTVGIDGFANASNNGKYVVVSCSSTQLVVNNPSGVSESYPPGSNPGVAIYGAPGDQSYSFDPRLAVDYEDVIGGPHANAVAKVAAAYENHNIHLHAIAGNAIAESQQALSCSSSDPTCLFPNEPGTVGFREGLDYIKNTNVETTTGVLGCDPTKSNTCLPVFQHGKKDSYHYAVFSHGTGLPSWFLSDGSLQSVVQSGNTVTFTTKLPHGISQIKQQANYAQATDTTCPNGRVTVVFAVTNSNLNGTFCVLSNPPPTATAFSINVGGSAASSSYKFKTDPDLSVANGQVTSISGYSDLGGQNSVISLGYGGWGPPYDPLSDGNQWQKKAGTFMHELGHTMALTHGGTFYNNLAGSNPPDYTPTFEVNCKSNVQTVMSYLFQFDLLHVRGASNKSGKPLMVVDYSNDSYATTIDETSPGGPLSGLTTYQNTASFQLPLVNSGAPHCDGSPLSPSDVEGGKSLTYVPFPDTFAGFSWSGGQDLNFNGNATDVMHSHDEWTGTPAVLVPPLGLSPGVDLQQVSSLGTITALGVGGEGGKYPPGGGGGKYPPGGGGGLFPPGGGGGKFPPGGGGGKYPPGGGGAKQDLTHEQANAYPRPAQDLTIVQEEASPRPIDLSWLGPTFGTPVSYNIYRSVGGPPYTFNFLTSVQGTQTTYQDQVPCNTAGYHYEIKAVVNNDMGQPLESTASNIVPAANEPPLTGCYTVSSFAPPASARQGNSVSVTWTLTDDEYVSPGTPWANAQANNQQVTRQAANTLVAIGPDPNNCANNKRTILVSDGVATNAIHAPEGQGLDTFTNNGNIFTFTWNNTDAFCAGHYTFELDLDHVSGSPAQTNTSTTVLALGVDVNDQDGIVINYVPLTDGTVGVAYPYTFTQHGGVGAITWSISKGSLPTGMTIDPGSGTLLGYATTACQCQFTVTATDSKGNVGSQQFTLVMHIWVSASAAPASPPFVANPTLPAMIVGVNSPDTVYQSGAVGSVIWNISGTPSGISQQGSSATISGTTCTAGSFALNAAATDTANNTGSLALTLPVNKASTTTTVRSDVNASVFQQPVTFTVTVTPQGSCGPATGTVTLSIDGVQFGTAQMLFSGSTSFGPLNTLSVNTHSITASYSGDSNFNPSNNNSASLQQTVNPAITQISNASVSLPSTVFVGQPVTISYTFSVQAPGAGSPIAPSGNITVTATDSSNNKSVCMTAASAALLGAGSCVLSPSPTQAGPVTFMINYPTDGNFTMSGANGNYTVYQLVFTTQPSNTGVGNTITPAVVVTAEDSTNNPLDGNGGRINFSGGITLAIGTGPGTLSGTLTQNAVAGIATFNDLSINKIANGYTLTASPAGGFPSATSNAFNIDTFYVDGSGNFGTLDLLTGTVTQISAGMATGSTGMDLTPGLLVYEYNMSNELVKIIPSTGAASNVGAGTIPDQATTGALTDASGSYFGIDAVTGNLYKIDLTTGATTPAGGVPTGAAVLPAGCNLDSSLTGSGSVLYYTVGFTTPAPTQANPNPPPCSAPMTDTLYQINPADGTSAGSPVTITVNDSGVNEFVGSAFVGGTLYGFTSGGQEYMINPTTGATSPPVNTTPTTAIIGAGSQ